MATAGELHPTEGIRLLLERQNVAEDGQTADYAATIYTPSESFAYSAVLKRGGVADLTPIGDASADADGEKRMLNLAKSTARSAERKEADGLTPWPERILRWRGPGRG